MARRGYLSVRLDEQLMSEVHGIFANLGMTAGDALTVIYNQVRMHKGLPFEVKIPNDETIQAMRDSESLENLTRHDSAEAMFKSWDMELS